VAIGIGLRRKRISRRQAIRVGHDGVADDAFVGMVLLDQQEHMSYNRDACTTRWGVGGAASASEPNQRHGDAE